MKRSKIIGLFLMTIGGLWMANYNVHSYELEEGYSIRFATSKAEGTFTGLKGVVQFEPADLSNSKMDVSVDVATIQTGNTKKDNHARGKKWFDAEKFPTMSFKMASIRRSGTGFVATGKLKVKDVTLEETIAFTYEKKDSEYFLEGVFQVNRKEYNIKGNLFGFAVGKEVSIYLSVPASFEG
ncbi:MAG: YceI family protein [Bacteroidota bacterium]